MWISYEFVGEKTAWQRRLVVLYSAQNSQFRASFLHHQWLLLLHSFSDHHSIFGRHHRQHFRSKADDVTFVSHRTCFLSPLVIMPWWPRTPNFFSSSSSPSSSSSSPNSPKYRHNQHRYESRRLTRQRKLRYLQDSDVGSVRALTGRYQPETLFKSSSVDNLCSTSGRSSLAVPQPLPLPELSALLRRDGYGNFKSSSPADFPLPSPKEMAPPSKGGVDVCKRDAVIKDWELNASIGSRIAYQDAEKVSELVDTWSNRKVSRDRNGIKVARENFRLNVPSRSAPTSPYSSPLLSPQGMTGDLFPSHHSPTKGDQIWSEPEMLISFPCFGFPHHVSPAKTTFSSESTPLNALNGSSPLYSPSVISPRTNARSPRQPASPLHKILSTETSTVMRESNGNANVHPLPLPPGASVPSLPAPIPQVAPKPEILTMTRQWQKGKLIGRGTFGSVYVATNLETGALCAMKEVELFPDDPKSAECIKQLEQEINVLSNLKHPNIVQYYGSETVEDKFCIYLEYVYPGSINKYVQEHCGAITESVVRNFTRHILCGLAYLHSTKTIHRDIKGANLLVDATGVVKLADFGMAKHLNSHASHLSMKGSPYWMAPELMQSVMQKDTRSDSALAVDIWSLGCTIIEMLNGKPPWSEYEGAAAMFKVMKESPPIPDSLSSEGKDFLRCCFQRNPDDRPSSSMLLAHPFLKSSQQMEVKSFTQVNGGILVFGCESGQQSHHQSPRSTLQAI